jgi:hypothetical protein
MAAQAFKMVEEMINQVKTIYVCSISQEGENGTNFRTVWSKPTKHHPIARPVVTVFFHVGSQNNITFHFENNSYRYTEMSQLNFEQALDAICNSKLVSSGPQKW